MYHINSCFVRTFCNKWIKLPIKWHSIANMEFCHHYLPVIYYRADTVAV